VIYWRSYSVYKQLSWSMRISTLDACSWHDQAWPTDTDEDVYHCYLFIIFSMHTHKVAGTKRCR